MEVPHTIFEIGSQLENLIPCASAIRYQVPSCGSQTHAEDQTHNGLVHTSFRFASQACLCTSDVKIKPVARILHLAMSINVNTEERMR